MKNIIISVLFINFLFAINLKEAITKTLQTYPDIKSLELKIKEIKQNYNSQKADNLPKLLLNAQYNFSQTYVNNLNGKIVTTNDTGYNVGLSLKQKLYDFNSNNYKLKSIKISKNIANLSLKDFKSLLAYKVKTTYYMALYQRDLIKIYKEDINIKSHYLAQSKEMYKEGLKTFVDVKNFEAALYDAKSSLINAKNEYQKDIYMLNLYTNSDIKSLASINFNDKIDTNIDNYLKTNYSIKIAKNEINQNNEIYKSTKNSKYGKINLVASYNKIGALNDEYDTKSIGINYEVSLFNPQVSANTKAAKLKMLQSQENLNSKLLNLKYEIKSTILEINKLTSQIQAKELSLLATKESNNLIKARYKQGLQTYIDVLDGLSKELDLKRVILNLKYQKEILKAKLKNLKGEI